MDENEFDHHAKFEKFLKKPKGLGPGKADDEVKDTKEPPPGWKKKLNPFADNTFIPPGWKKVGDTYVEE